MKSTAGLQLRRRMILLGTPAPRSLRRSFTRNLDPANTSSALAPQVNLFLALHIVQLGTFGLLGLVIYLLLDGAKGLAADISRGALAVFVVLYSAFDAAEGIGTGLLIQFSPNFERSRNAHCSSTD